MWVGDLVVSKEQNRFLRGEGGCLNASNLCAQGNLHVFPQRCKEDAGRANQINSFPMERIVSVEKRGKCKPFKSHQLTEIYYSCISAQFKPSNLGGDEEEAVRLMVTRDNGTRWEQISRTSIHKKCGDHRENDVRDGAESNIWYSGAADPGVQTAGRKRWRLSWSQMLVVCISRQGQRLLI